MKPPIRCRQIKQGHSFLQHTRKGGVPHSTKHQDEKQCTPHHSRRTQNRQNQTIPRAPTMRNARLWLITLHTIKRHYAPLPITDADHQTYSRGSDHNILTCASLRHAGLTWDHDRLAESEKTSQSDDDGSGCEDDAVSQLQKSCVTQGADEVAAPGISANRGGGSTDQWQEQERHTH